MPGGVAACHVDDSPWKEKHKKVAAKRFCVIRAAGTHHTYMFEKPPAHNEGQKSARYAHVCHTQFSL